MSAPPQQGTAADWLFDQLASAIVSGALRPGSKISEPELAANFGTSRAPLREAIRRLEERKLVTRVAHAGARVTTISPGRTAEIFLIREVLEGIAAREAARRMTGPDIDELQALLNVHLERVNSSDLYRQGMDDDDFHFRIIRASGNATLVDLLLDEYYLLIRMLRGQIGQGGAGARRAWLEHRRIADALADHDAELAEILMRRHIVAAHARITDQLQRTG